MCWAPLGAGARTLRHDAVAADGETWVKDDVATDVLLLAVELELELPPHPAIARATAMIGNALRTGRQAKQISRGRAADVYRRRMRQ
jgi:hypothetical protein